MAAITKFKNLGFRRRVKLCQLEAEIRALLLQVRRRFSGCVDVRRRGKSHHLLHPETTPVRVDATATANICQNRNVHIIDLTCVAVALILTGDGNVMQRPVCAHHDSSKPSFSAFGQLINPGRVTREAHYDQHHPMNEKKTHQTLPHLVEELTLTSFPLSRQLGQNY